MNRRIHLPGIAFIVLLLISSCRKENGQQTPYAPVNLTININNPQYVDLGHAGGWVYSSGGLKGLILYRKDQTTINAYDRQSPVDPKNPCVLYVDSSNIYCVDSCTVSKFLITDGSAQYGPASRGMIQYQTEFDGTMLTIIN